MDRIEFDALSSKIKELETEVESLKTRPSVYWLALL